LAVAYLTTGAWAFADGQTVAKRTRARPLLAPRSVRKLDRREISVIAEGCKPLSAPQVSLVCQPGTPARAPTPRPRKQAAIGSRNPGRIDDGCIDDGCIELCIVRVCVHGGRIHGLIAVATGTCRAAARSVRCPPPCLGRSLSTTAPARSSTPCVTASSSRPPTQLAHSRSPPGSVFADPCAPRRNHGRTNVLSCPFSKHLAPL
jgi:hypothetical protein